MEVLLLIGRILVGGYYLFNGLNHLLQRESLARYAAAKGVPYPHILVPLSGVPLLVGGLSLLLGVYPKVGVAALVLFLLPVTFWMHAFWKEEDLMRRIAEMVEFTKNLALLGSALMFLAIPEPWPYSLG